ncbi:hypothetical protein LSM04_009232 [Trypanosoma melophagium]|uniref:uncharacterized protein n=1 Tax=Trypanosoma melophagium TaxID=715481 RepID=UPI00351AA6A4|nr:hypothetical protein LSM04_009232 [Trypanosoma melophagium]
MHVGCGPKGQFLTKQKRPAAVAYFLNKIPLDERHAATNALLLLGLRAYERAVADAPADVRTLRAIAAMEVMNDCDDTQTHMPRMERADKMNSIKSSLTPTKTSVDVQDSSNKVGDPLSRQDSNSLKLSSPNAKTDKNVIKKDNNHTMVTKCGSGGVSSSSSSSSTPLLFQKTNVLLDQAKKTPENKGNITAGSLLPVACSGSSSRGSASKRQLCSETPALSFILRDALEGTIGHNIRASSSTGIVAGSSNGTNVAFHGDDQSTTNDLSVYDVSDGTEEQGNAVDRDNGIYTESTIFPLNGSDEEYYPIDFLRCLRKHIESTNGRRENPLLVAASIPQCLAVYTLRSGFDNLYRSLLISYHLSNEANKWDNNDSGN